MTAEARENQESEKENKTEISVSSEVGNLWIGRLAKIYGEPYLQFKGDIETPQEFARFQFRDESSETAFHLSVSRLLHDERPRFRVDLSLSVGDHPTSIYCSSIRHFTTDPSSGSCIFLGDRASGEEFFQLELDKTGHFELKSIDQSSIEIE